MKTEMVRARVTAEEKAAYEETAGREPLSSWVRRTLNEAVATPAVEKQPPLMWTPDMSPPVKDSNPDEVARMTKDVEEAGPVRRCEQWRNHRAGRFCKTCQQTMPV